jgi:pyrimidine oxygenase
MSEEGDSLLTAFGLPSDRGGKDLGIYLPMANGGWILSSTAPPLDGSYEYNRQVALLAEEAGLDFIMSMATWRGFGGTTGHWRCSLDSQILMTALAVQTRRVKVWTTVHPLLQNPAVTAKMIATLDQVSGGRAGLNIVTGAHRGEFEQMGAWRRDLGHDARHDLATEWVRIIKRLWSEPEVSFPGRYFSFEDCQSDPKPVSRPRPFLIGAGTSGRGMQFTVEEADAIFCGGRDDAELSATCRLARQLAREAGRGLRCYAMMTLVLGATDAEAQATAQSYREGFDEGALRGLLRAYGFPDSEIGKESAFVANARSGFLAPRTIGAPATVTQRLIGLIEGCELDGLMLIFPEYLTDMRVFADSILPRLRERFRA